MNPRRLFITRPSEILEHPLELPLTIKNIPLGPIEGWDCFGPNWGEGGASRILGPFQAVVKEATDQHRSMGLRSVYIEAGDTQFWFQENSDRPSWYQSGCTLRFIKKINILNRKVAKQHDW